MLRPALVLALVVLPACREKTHVREFSGASAFGYIETQVAFGPRIPGTEAHRRAGAWLDSLLRQRADTLITQA
jgi:hypothetical protein